MTPHCLTCANLDPTTLTCHAGHEPTVEPVASPFPWLPGNAVTVTAPDTCDEWEVAPDA